MRTLAIVAAFAAILFYVTPMTAADTAAGKDMYAKKCASCHNTDGEGKDSIAKMFKVDMKPLGSKDIQAKGDADLKKVVLEGSGKMKPVKDVDAKAADDIVAYLRTLAKK